MVFPDHLKKMGFYEHIKASVQDLVGSPMLFQLFNAAREWIEGHPFSVYRTPVATIAQEHTTALSQRSVCKFYAKGSCKYGSKCRNYHPDSEPSPSKRQESPNDADISLDSEEKFASSLPDQESITSGAGKAELSQPPNKESDPKSDNKKQSMRTASDVISRVLWDPDIKTEEFIIGYLDRFVGIIEKPFNAFSWEDLSTVGANVLAIPKHRIQYFKYKQEVVWDKTARLDNVFGSCGGKLIQEVVESNDKNLSNGGSGEEVGVVSEGDALKAKAQVHKDRPTHYVCVRVSGEEIISNIQRIQRGILAHSPQLADGCLAPTTLHVTVCMVKLDTPSHFETAKKVLEDTKKNVALYLPRCAEIKFTGVDQFRDRLIYAKVAPNASLDKFSHFLIERFKKAGLKTPGNYAQYTPHMTLVKLCRPMQHALHIATISRNAFSQFSDEYIGKQEVDGIYLRSTAEAKEECCHFFSNSLLTVSPLLSAVIAKCVYQLQQCRVVHEAEGAELIKCTTKIPNSASDTTSFDKSVEKIRQMIPSACSPLGSRVVILRGLPGSGKSHLARNCSEKSVAAICSADHFFTKSDCYEFKQDDLPDAHVQCYENFLQALVDGKEVIIVDNTNSMTWEYRSYLYLCEMLGIKFHILEIPHPHQQMVSAYCTRNLHKVSLEAINSFVERWEEDKRAMLVPPKIAYPQSAQSDISLVNLCQPGYLPKEVLASSTTLVPVYTGIFLTPKSQWKLLSCITPTHPKIHADHSTMAFEPHLDVLSSTDIGKKVSVVVEGLVDSSMIQAVTVTIPTDLCSQNKHPHITLSAEEAVAPKHANSVLQSQPTKPVSNQLKLNGVIGVVVKDLSEVEHGKTYTILSRKHFNDAVLPRLVQSIPSEMPPTLEGEKPVVLESAISICTGAQTITKLFVFDFDGTLFKTPDPVSGRQFYEESTGHMWPYTGWLSRPESLLPPLKIKPGPALAEYRRHFGRAGSYTVILTSRRAQTEAGVRAVLVDHQLSPDELILKPGDTRKPSPDFKVHSLSQLLEIFPEVREVKFWDDLNDNLQAVRRYLKRPENSKIKYDVVDATTMIQNAHGASDRVCNSILGSYLLRCGLIPTNTHTKAAQTGIDFIASQFSAIIGYEGDPGNITLVFGSHLLVRKSDVDMCLLVPPGLTHFECVDRLAEQLDKCGITHIHKGFSTRCPRLKVMLHFQDTPSIDYDIVFAVLPSQEVFSTCASKPGGVPDVERFCASDDRVSKAALSGHTLMCKVRDIVKDFIPLEVFGAVVEMTLQVLTAQRERGNFFHHLRSFHIVLLLADFISKGTGQAVKGTDCDSLFRSFITHTAMLTAQEWQKVFENYVYVAPAFIPRHTPVFQTLSKMIKQEEISLDIRYGEMLTRPVFPPFGHTPVCLLYNSGGPRGDHVLQWKFQTLLEVKVPAFLQQLAASGLDVVLDGNGFLQFCLCFAVQDTATARKSLQQEISKLWNDFSEYRSRKDFKLEQRFGGRFESAASSDVCKQVEKFVSSDLLELYFPDSLNAYERRLVHETAERLKVSHKTIGEGSKRHIYLHK